VANMPIAAQVNLLMTGGKVTWGVRPDNLLPDDPGQPEKLCCATGGAVIQQQTSEAVAVGCALEQFMQSMVKLGGTRDFICKNPLLEADQPGWNPFTKSVDATRPIKYEQPYFLQGLWDEVVSRELIAQYGKRNEEMLLIYFQENNFLSEATIIKHQGWDYRINDIRQEPMGDKVFIRTECEMHSDNQWMLANTITKNIRYQLEGRIFYTDGSGKGDVDNIFVFDPDNAKVDVYDDTGLTFLFSFGEDIAVYPVGSKYTEYEKWFTPISAVTTADNTIVVLDDMWKVYVHFTLDGNAIKAEPYYRRR